MNANDQAAFGANLFIARKPPIELACDARAVVYTSNATTRRTWLGEPFEEILPYAVPRHVEQPQLRNRVEDGLCAVAPQERSHTFEQLLAVLWTGHINEIHDDDAANIAQAKLPGDCFGSF
jgi:hypothetical protein